MALEMVNHTYNLGIAGDATTQMTFVCDESEWEYQVNVILNSTDTVSPNLVCKTVRATPLQAGGREDWNCGKVQLVADYVPRLSVEALTVDMPFKWRMEASGQTVTIQGQLKWASDNEPFLKRGALPVKRFSLVKIVLYGTRSAFSLDLYKNKLDHVNSDVFLGAEAGTVLFESAQVQQKMLLDGSIIYSVELHMTYRPFGWNNTWRDYPSQEDQLLNMDGSSIYPETALSYLLG